MAFIEKKFLLSWAIQWNKYTRNCKKQIEIGPNCLIRRAGHNLLGLTTARSRMWGLFPHAETGALQ